MKNILCLIEGKGTATKWTVWITSTVLLSLLGCTHTRQLSDYDTLNVLVKGKTARITLSNGVTVKGKSVNVTPDSTFWLSSTTNSRQAAATSEVRELRFINRGRGAWEGFRGFLVAGGIMGMIGFASGDDPPGFLSLKAEEKALLGLAAGVSYGVILGLPIGAAVGSKDVHLLESKEK